MLLDAAEACFADYGVAQTSMGDVAARAGVSRPTLYRCFADRETLSVEVVMRRSRRLIARAQAHLARHRRFSDQLVEGLLFLVEHGRRDEIVMELITDGRPSRATERLADSETAQRITREVWRPLLERARRRGELRSDLSLDDTFTWLVYVQVVMIVGPALSTGPGSGRPPVGCWRPSSCPPSSRLPSRSTASADRGPRTATPREVSPLVPGSPIVRQAVRRVVSLPTSRREVKTGACWGRMERRTGMRAEPPVALMMAIPRDGELATRAASLVTAAGYGLRPDAEDGERRPRRLDVKVFALPERDVAVYASRGGLDLALCGSLALEEASTLRQVLLQFESGRRELVLFGVDGHVGVLADLAGARVATPYPHVLRRHLAARGIGARAVIGLDPVEHAGELGIADAVAVVVDRSAPPPKPYRDMSRLSAVQPQQLVLVEGNPPVSEADLAARDLVINQLRGANRAETVQMVQYECRTATLASTVSAVQPLGSSEISSPRPDGWSTVRVLLDRGAVPAAMQRLLVMGCRSVLTLDLGVYHPGLASRTSAAPVTDLPDPRPQADRPAPRSQV